MSTACSSILPHDSAPPTGLVADNTPWAGTFHSDDLPVGVGSLSSLSCPSPLRCWATVSTVGGTTPASGAAGGASASAGAGAGADGATVLATRNGGATWTAETLPAAISYLSGISCIDTSRCAAVGQVAVPGGTQGVAIWTADGGRTWTVVPPPVGGTTDVTTVTCLAGGHCLAVGSGPTGAVSLVSTSAGRQWSLAGPLPPGTLGATQVSCADGAHCWASGQVALDVAHQAGAVDETSDFGAQWTPLPLPPGTGLLGGISCAPATGPGASLPYTASTGGGAAPGSGASTTTIAAGPGTPTTSTTAPPAPSSTTTTVPGVPGYRCAVVGTTSTTLGAARSGRGVILTTTNGGSSWTAERVPAEAASFTGLACPASGACAAVGTTTPTVAGSGLVVLTGDGNDPWTRSVTLTVPQPLAAVSCPATAHCVMGGVAVTEGLDASS